LLAILYQSGLLRTVASSPELSFWNGQMDGKSAAKQIESATAITSIGKLP
jgi:hypothetical protein